MPVWAIIASRLACGLVSTASVATTASVVLSAGVAAGPPLIRIASISGENDGGKPRPPNSPSCSNGAAQNHGPLPTVALPTAFTTASAPTVMPDCVLAEAEPSPPLNVAVVAPIPAPTLPSAKSSAAATAA